jgi:hypothetical protein
MMAERAEFEGAAARPTTKRVNAELRGRGLNSVGLSGQRLNKNRTVRGRETAKVVGVARQEHPTPGLGCYRHHMSVDNVFGPDAPGVEHRSDEPSKGTVGVPASDGLLVPSEE